MLLSQFRIDRPSHHSPGLMPELLDLSERQARSEAKKLDNHRSRLLKAYFEADINDPLGYDAVWNTQVASPHEIAEATAAVLRRRVSEYPAR